MTRPAAPVPTTREVLDSARDAARLLDGISYRTPIHTSRALSEVAGLPVLLKCENLQRSGSFKLRGAYVRMARLDDESRARGVVAASAGNHAQGVALAAAELGIPAVVYMPTDAALPKVAATRDYGAEVRLVGDSVDEALAAAAAESARSGAVLIHPYDHRDVVAGQATVALEIAEQVPDAGTVLVPLGGGGLTAGIAAVLAEVLPSATVVGVQAERAAAWPSSLAAGSLGRRRSPRRWPTGSRSAPRAGSPSGSLRDSVSRSGPSARTRSPGRCSPSRSAPS
ncbi:hypothetical protein GCM10025865_20790 [Paraoerskovia sediminicola]|uniref:Tryptophan synthase beta chain-like PALP domain-containing protein n=1 Tax=Paraoerskovia sediminicola TaxID=1138587 RepID=A0ABN6XG53_9CELL|nr:hypothetical protein GCM10025865_20790 [Paraoerskovia sediminicola]